MSENLDLKIRAEMRKRRMTFKELAALIGMKNSVVNTVKNLWNSVKNFFSNGVGDTKILDIR
ncbi:hypothetical protein EfmAA242_20100 [Enterococcus faecium]|nr:hypothetical protein EfmAA242_20100 [Enterococcus faecium]